MGMYKIATVIDQEGVILNHAILEEEDVPFYEMKQAAFGYLVLTRDFNDENFLADVKDAYDPACIDVSRWLIEDVCDAKIFCKMKEYPISDDLYKAAKKVYDAKNLEDAEKLTLEFINTHCK